MIYIEKVREKVKVKRSWNYTKNNICIFLIIAVWKCAYLGYLLTTNLSKQESIVSMISDF